MVDFEIARHALKNIGEEISEHEVTLNKFADWSNEEYLSILGYKFNPKIARTNVEVFDDVNDLPDSINWVDQGKVTPVKD